MEVVVYDVAFVLSRKTVLLALFVGVSGVSLSNEGFYISIYNM